MLAGCHNIRDSIAVQIGNRKAGGQVVCGIGDGGLESTVTISKHDRDAVGIKVDDEIGDPSPENVKKYEYAVEHFKRLNQWLEKEKVTTRYQFNMLTPKDYNKFFNELRKGKLAGFTSEIDVAMRKSDGDKE